MPTIAYDAEWRTKVAGGNKPPPTLNTEEALFCISVSSLGLVVGQLSCLWLVLAQIFGRADLVHAHESAVASHIGRKDRCKPAFDALLCHGRLSPLGYRLRNLQRGLGFDTGLEPALPLQSACRSVGFSRRSVG
jgi:hypothetical protein